MEDTLEIQLARPRCILAQGHGQPATGSMELHTRAGGGGYPQQHIIRGQHHPKGKGLEGSLTVHMRHAMGSITPVANTMELTRAGSLSLSRTYCTRSARSLLGRTGSTQR